MTASHKVVVVERQDRVVGVEELGVEDNLDPVLGPVEQLYPSDLVENGVCGVVHHVVGDNGRECFSLEGKHSSLEQHSVGGGKQLVEAGDLLSVVAVVAGTMVEHSSANLLLDFVDGVLQSLHNGLALEGLHCV